MSEPLIAANDAANDAAINLANSSKIDIQIPPGFRVVGEEKTSIDEELREELIEHPQTISATGLHDHTGRAFDVTRFKGKWSFLVFGYTNCPDICPTTLAEMDDFFALLSDKKQKGKKTSNKPLLDNTQLFFVTLDPKRDTDKDLKQYLSYFNSQFVGLSGSVEDLHRFCDPLKIKFEYEQITKSVYGVGHSSSVILIDPEMRYFARFQVPIYAEELLAKYRKIVLDLKKSS